MSQDEIAIVGMACRFPGAKSPSEFWNLLISGESTVGTFPESRREAGTSHQFAGGYLPDISGFDPEYFGISPHQARYMDPQQRLMMEMAAEAIEDAGVPPEKLAGPRTGVYVGISTHDYAILVWSSSRPHAGATSGTSNAAAANLISHWLGARGPSLAIDTACSSSLTALHYAAQAIRSNEIDFAIVGGVSILLIPSVTEAFASAGLISNSGVCRPFDRKADGYVRSEGCAALLLRNASAAEADGDRIYAMVRGSAINHNGFSAGFTAPNPVAQAEAIQKACQDAGITPSELSYVEAMGSSTVLGDAMELRAIARALNNNSPSKQHCIIGSVKGNVGHMEAASGLAAVLKTALSLSNEQIAPTANLREPSEATWPGLPATNERPMPWPENSDTRFAGVNSTGFGGANAHVVLANARSSKRERRLDSPGTYVLFLSAKTESAFHDLILLYRQFLKTTTESPADICYTASAGRSHYRFRTAVCGKDNHQLAYALDQVTAPVITAERPSKIDFFLPARPQSLEPSSITEFVAVHPVFQRIVSQYLEAFPDASPVKTFQYGLAMFLIENGLRPTQIISETEDQADIAHALLRRLIPAHVPSVIGLESTVTSPYRLEVHPDGRLLLNNIPVKSEPWPVGLWQALYMAGAPFEWNRLYMSDTVRKATLPHYPRKQRPFWFEPDGKDVDRLIDGGSSLLEEIEYELDSLGY